MGAGAEQTLVMCRLAPERAQKVLSLLNSVLSFYPPQPRASLQSLSARGVPEVGFSPEYSEGVEVADSCAERETQLGRGHPACSLLALPAILQPPSPRHLPGPEKNLGFSTDV